MNFLNEITGFFGALGNSVPIGTSEGLYWAVLALGLYISYRLLDFADLTCEGSLTLGASMAALTIYKGGNAFLAVLFAFCAGALAGTVTGLLHTKLKIPSILAGILTMTSLYSINIRVMSAASGSNGTSNLSLLNFSDKTLYNFLKSLTGMNKKATALVFGAVFVIAIIVIMYWFFGTEIGCAIRATGNNEKMCRAQGINTDNMKILGLALANGLIAVSGALNCQYNNSADAQMGVGSIVIGLASIIIGEAIFGRINHFFFRLVGVAVGAVIYRIVYAFIFNYNRLNNIIWSSDVKLMTAIVVIVALVIISSKGKKVKKQKNQTAEGEKNG